MNTKGLKHKSPKGMSKRAMKRRWSTDSPSQQHIQHQVANGRPLSIRLSKVRIQPWAAVHKKNATRLGIFGFQTPFQGNKEFEAPRIASLAILLSIIFSSYLSKKKRIWEWESKSWEGVCASVRAKTTSSSSFFGQNSMQGTEQVTQDNQNKIERTEK